MCEHFSTHFLGPVADSEDTAEDDELGYYDDGVKRTLTDEQIAIFRHSEIEALLREQRHEKEAKELSASPTNTSRDVAEDVEEGEVGEVLLTTPTVADTSTVDTSDQKCKSKSGKLNTKQRKAQYAKEKGFFKQKIKPDLRKRTWDKVEAGMDSLAYDESSTSTAKPGLVSQRRKISYDDDW